MREFRCENVNTSFPDSDKNARQPCPRDALSLAPACAQTRTPARTTSHGSCVSCRGAFKSKHDHEEVNTSYLATMEIDADGLNLIKAVAAEAARESVPVAAEVPDAEDNAPPPAPVGDGEADERSAAASTPEDLAALLMQVGLSTRKKSPYLQGLIDAVRSKADAAVSKDGSLKPSTEAADDIRIMRFLGANKWDAAAAAEEYVSSLKSRKAKGLDALRDEIVAKNPGFFGGKEELDCIYVHGTSKALQEVNPRTFTDVRTEGPYRLLRDKRGNLVVIECVGVVDYAAIAAVGFEPWTKEFFTFNELRVLVLDELSRRCGKLLLTNTVMDMSHINMMPNPFAPKVEKDGKAAAKASSEVTKEVYPTTTFRNYMVNLSESTAKAAGPLIKALVPKRSADKLKIFGPDFQSALHEDVDCANLPQRYGGELPDGIQFKLIDAKGKKK